MPRYGWFNLSDGCYYRVVNPPPPPSDLLWGNEYPKGAIYNRTCLDPYVRLDGGTALTLWLATPPPGMPVVVTPAKLAQEALATVHLPAPTIERSPQQNNSDNGVPYTWVNLWTWFWTAPATWHSLSATASAGGVWATVRLVPTALVFDPGDGGDPVPCDGPGRPWTTADGNDPPSGGGCGYVYRHVTANGPLTATVSIDWAVTWTGSGGAGGTLPVMHTQARSTFAVEQIQVVNR